MSYVKFKSTRIITLRVLRQLQRLWRFFIWPYKLDLNKIRSIQYGLKQIKMSKLADSLSRSSSLPKKSKAWERLYQNSIDRQLVTLDSASTCASPSPRRRRTFVELDLLVRHEVSKVRKSFLREQSLSTEVSECSHRPAINRYSELIALKLVEKEKKVLEEIAVPKCYVNIKTAVKEGKNRPRTDAE